mmetsp:Transcript_29238/g.89459  ORF Transcript_29238/g.89459 Transcript_29238/m.89459 type:complete len:223 (+) Transcript_29238:3-671(+)
MNRVTTVVVVVVVEERGEEAGRGFGVGGGGEAAGVAVFEDVEDVGENGFGFCGVSDPEAAGGGAGGVVVAGVEELVADVEGVGGLDVEEALEAGDADALVADVDPDVAAAVEGAVGRFSEVFEGVLGAEDGFVQEFAACVLRNQSDGARFAHDARVHLHVGDGVSQGLFSDVEQRSHLGLVELHDRRPRLRPRLQHHPTSAAARRRRRRVVVVVVEDGPRLE